MTHRYVLGFLLLCLALLSAASGVRLMVNRAVQPLPTAQAPAVEQLPPTLAGDDLPPPTAPPTSAALTPARSPQQAVRFVQGVAVAPDTLNPLLTANTTTQAMARLIYPTLVGQDPTSGAVAPTGLATGWEISPDGLVYTFAMAADRFWSDGTPVTADDVAFSLNAVRREEVESPWQATLAILADVQAPDPQNLVLTLQSADCAILAALLLPVLPAHRYAADYSDFADAPQSREPTVSAGPFRFLAYAAGERIELVRALPAESGGPLIDQFVLRVLPDADVRLAALRNGEIDLVEVDAADAARYTGLPDVTLVTYPADSFTFVALNLADPAAPLPGQDAEGARLPQPPHPILGEQRLRYALAVAVDTAPFQAVAGDALLYKPASYLLPSVGWAYNDELKPIQTNPQLAGQLLDSVGWRDEDGDGRRTRAGVVLALTLQVNDDSTERVAMARSLAQQWAAIGVAVTVVVQPFDQMTQELLAQQIDMALLGWDNLGADPANAPFWHSRNDIPGAGFNFVSFQDAAVDEELDAALRSPACRSDQRAARYRRVQALVAEQQPYILLEGRLAGWAYRTNWSAIQGAPWQIYHNVARWQSVDTQPPP